MQYPEHNVIFTTKLVLLLSVIKLEFAVESLPLIIFNFLEIYSFF